jgi:hypothetical protein
MLCTKRLLIAPLLWMFWSSPAVAEETPTSAPLTQQQAKALEARASTSEEHAHLAAYYRREERRLDDKARYHDEMREIYRKRPLPFDGKMAVPMERHCTEWAWHFRGQAERAAVLAAFHNLPAGSSNATYLSELGDRALRTTGFIPAELTLQATPEQSSLFHDSVAASIRFYGMTRILTYIVNANHRPLVETSELRKAATILFNLQTQFVDRLSPRQRSAVDDHLIAVGKLRHKIEADLNRLEALQANPANKDCFKAANKLKGTLERWNVEQRAIALQLQIEN